MCLVDKNQRPRSQRHIRRLIFLRKAAGIIVFITSLFGLAKMVLEFSDLVEQRVEHRHAKSQQ